LRTSGAGWSIYQQGTYAPADAENRWMGSIAMNGNGDIAAGFNISSSNTFPSIHFSGRQASDAAGPSFKGKEKSSPGAARNSAPMS
jgi:hypothetical protein